MRRPAGERKETEFVEPQQRLGWTNPVSEVQAQVHDLGQTARPLPCAGAAVGPVVGSLAAGRAEQQGLTRVIARDRNRDGRACGQEWRRVVPGLERQRLASSDPQGDAEG